MAITIIRLGKGEVVSNWGSHNGVPAIFIEPAKPSGDVGCEVCNGEQPHIHRDCVADGGIVIEIHDPAGFQIVVEDGYSALGMNRKQGKHI